ncbi:hypothetical protein [Limnobacter sp.]|uniref:hypothetical protein n=1 Tax=Limnobacter sp. TaxID=2003368 RepID=UPI003747D399
MNVKSLLALSATAALLSACLSSGESTTTTTSGASQPVTPSETPLQLSEFSVANGCFGLQSTFSRQFVQPAAARYAAGPATEAENFTMRPTELGKYLIYGSDRQMITAQGNTLVASAEPTDAAVWQASFDKNKNQFSFADATGRFLALDETAGLTTAAEPNELAPNSN